MARYINKDALVAEIERRISDNKKDIERASHKNLEDYFEGYEDALALLKQQYLDTLEVKEVDLEAEYDNYTKHILACDVQFKPFTHLYNCAKYFFELGLNTKGKKVMAQEEKQLLLKDLEWIDMETKECHCYNCELFDSKNNICKYIDLCKRPKNTYKGFYIK